MVVAVFVRRLKEGVSFEEFERGWQADEGYGVPARVVNAVSLEDPRDVLSIGFVGVSAAAIESGAAATKEHDQGRHDRIDELIESTELRAMYELRSEHDFSGEPRAIEPESQDSIFASVTSWGIDR